jgi:hypothetical protein
MPCEACQLINKKRGKKPDCEKCLPKLFPENEDAAAVYSQVRNQAIYVGMEAVPVDLDFKSVKIVMDFYDIKNKADCFQRVLKMWHHVAELDRIKRKKG